MKWIVAVSPIVFSSWARRNLNDIGSVKLRNALLLVCSLCCVAAPHLAVSQVVQGAQPSSAPVSPGRPVPLRHLYWHFLVHLNDLNTMAKAREAQGKDGTWLRTHLQKSLGFSDAEYAPLLDAASRLASEIRALDSQAAAIRAGSYSASNVAALKRLASQREADINAEIQLLKISLPAEKITTLESFMTQFFSPKLLSAHVGSSSQQAGSAEVQP